MARMRTLKPEAATSETLAMVPREVRWTFGMLWTYLDDEGRGLRNARLIKAAIYPLDDDMTGEVIADELAQLRGIGAVCFYEVDGKEYVHVPSWDEHQHPNRKVPSKIPPCVLTDHSLSLHTPSSEGAKPLPASNPTSPNESGAHTQRTEPSVNTHGALTSVVVVVGGEVDGEGEVDGGGEAQAPTTARTVIAEWIEHSPKRPPGQVINVIGKHVRAMLGEGIDPDDVRRGLAAWMDKGLHESTLPSVVNEVMNGGGRRATRKRDTDDKVRDGLALAQRLLAGEEEPTIAGKPRQIGA